MLTQIDIDALERAIEIVRKERRTQIDAMLEDESRESVGVFCAGCAQASSLRLDPWQTLPCDARIHDLTKPRDDPRGERRAAELLRHLLDVGLSRFEPNPLRAIAEAEQRQAAK
jgi:hypothetical protein